VCFDFLHNFYIEYFSLYEDLSEIKPEILVRVGLHVKYPLFLSDFSESWNYLEQIFENKKNAQISKCQENPSSGNRVVPCGRTDRQTDMRKLWVIVAFRNIANASKSSHSKRLPSRLSHQSTCVTWQTTHAQGHLVWRMTISFPFTWWPGREVGRGGGNKMFLRKINTQNYKRTL
jgi:hypothetical protein